MHMTDNDHLDNLLSPRQWLLRLVFWGGALAVGAAAVLFALGARISYEWFHWILSISPWLPFVIMPSGLALSVWLSRRFFEGSQGSGIPQTIAALRIQNLEQLGKLLSLRIAVGKIVLTLLALCSGASVGREGPTVQIGASIMYSLRKFSRFTHQDQMKGLIVAGGAAGVAAAFNTPLAGIVFAIEELSRSFEQRTNGLILTAVIFAGLAAHAVLGNYTYFGTVSTSIDTGIGWLAVLACGVAGGLFGGLFARLLISANDGWSGVMGHWMRSHPVRFAAACGLVLAGLGALSGQHTYGTGYDEVHDILEHGDADYLGFGVLKFLATLVSYLSGIPGGIFAPSLAVGAGMGATFSHFISFVPADTVIVLGMVAYFSGVTQAPLTSFVIVMEMTNNHSLALPLMATALIAHGISRIVYHEPLYKALAERFVRRMEQQ
ncbi:Cl- channel voltage-gated family protein [Sulfuricella denitrificans skB26]|uniref:Cl-channel voltage-gated family protein n=1 Tax=Sulfuricella denitrificans (strain DSM 22764 / NBRC 105220 / skB26) TaxID=1163617 RepID=S6AKA6_SULDS|nr:chloride channel protein [Sulfuricella denitrificans]BAN35034.1 Cl- channel voltage-gated family protein [Sulfuricella denitrificans skB26]